MSTLRCTRRVMTDNELFTLNNHRKYKHPNQNHTLIATNKGKAFFMRGVGSKTPTSPPIWVGANKLRNGRDTNGIYLWPNLAHKIKSKAKTRTSGIDLSWSVVILRKPNVSPNGTFPGCAAERTYCSRGWVGGAQKIVKYDLKVSTISLDHNHEILSIPV